MSEEFKITRRQMLISAVATGTTLHHLATHTANSQTANVPTADSDKHAITSLEGTTTLRWLEDNDTSAFMGVTCGVAWPMGEVKPDTTFSIHNNSDRPIPTQNWTLAKWPDGTIKWSAHAIAPQHESSMHFTVVHGEPTPTPPQMVTVKSIDAAVVVDTGTITYRVPTSGENIIESIERDGRVLIKAGKLVCLNQDQPSEPTETEAPTGISTFQSQIENVTVEQDGPVRAVIRIEGKHAEVDAAQGRQWLPFTLRFYFYAGSDHVRVMHSFIYDGDEHKDFIRGLGLRFDVPMSDETYNRHTRFVSADGGLWAEAIKGITGLRRDPGEKVRSLQVMGKALPPESEWDQRVTSRLHLIPTWGDVTLSQLSSDGYEITKRTKPGHGWIQSNGGTKAAGVGYVGGVSGGVVFGQRDFWQRHPAQLDIRAADSDQAQVTMWMWSPQAKAMDLRFYHDGLGQDTHKEQLEGLNITYEDYEPGFGTPHGIARTTEFHLWIVDKTPGNEQIIHFAKDVMTPPLLAASPKDLRRAQVFGPIWDLPDRSTPARERIENNLDFAFESYANQSEQRRWYGFWDYGDVMHTYDPDRHVWRYDVGGYAWDNSELSPDLWLWYFFLRTGRADVFRFAEAMTRHTGEVDVYHLGRFKGLGTRHNVQHWGCSAKQLRISTVAYRRFYYYLTADERTGDLMREQVGGAETFTKLDPIRKIRTAPYEPKPRALSVGMGTDYSGLAMAWFTEWERTGDEQIKQKLLNSMETIGQMERGWFTASPLFDPETGKYVSWNDDPKAAGMSHLSAVFGLFEICAELIQNFDVPGFEKNWLMYCKYYSAPRQQRKEDLGIDFRNLILINGHSRLTAYAAWKTGDPDLTERAWKDFYHDDNTWATTRWTFERKSFSGVDSLNPVEETPWMGTNDASQWGLAAIQDLALVGQYLPKDDPRSQNK